VKAIKVSCTGAATLPMSKIHALQGNLKALSDENAKRLEELILDNGITAPIHVWKDPNGKHWNLDGHQRIRVLKRLAKKRTIPPLPVVFVEARDTKHAKKILLSNVSQFGHAAEETLYEFMHDAGIGYQDFAQSFDVPGIDTEHFGRGYFKDVMFSAKGAAEDDVPIVREKARTKPGQIFKLGDHRLMCGDSTDAAQVGRLMGDHKAMLWSSDPPYGINHVEVANEKRQAKGYKKIENDELQDEALRAFILKAITTSLAHMGKGFAFYMWHAMKMQAYFSQAAAAAAAAAGILFHRQIIWVKPSFVFGRGQYHWRHELCLMGWMQGEEPQFYGERNQSTVWEVGRENDKIHPTQKPVELFAIPIRNHLKAGEVLYEPFAGSGSNFIAAEKEKVRCFGMEIDPNYCDVIIARWRKYSGKKAELIGEAKRKR